MAVTPNDPDRTKWTWPRHQTIQPVQGRCVNRVAHNRHRPQDRLRLELWLKALANPGPSLSNGRSTLRPRPKLLHWPTLAEAHSGPSLSPGQPWPKPQSWPKHWLKHKDIACSTGRPNSTEVLPHTHIYVYIYIYICIYIYVAGTFSVLFGPPVEQAMSLCLSQCLGQC